MATVLGSLLISLGLDSGQFRSGMSEAEKELVKSQRRIEKIGRGMQDVGQQLTLGLTVPLAAFAGFSVKAASDAAELQSAFDQTFGSMSESLTQWAEETGDAMGRSTREIQQAANTFGIFFNQAAPTRQAAAELSQQFTVLAQDLSSFFNVDPTVALEKLRSGLAGESEPLRDFGVFLNEAAVKAKAFELGIAKAGSELTEQQKIMARAALIMEATTAAQGDVARTADGTANRVRAAKAAFEELQVAIGEKLIPALNPLITGLTGLLNGFASIPGPVQTGIVVIAGFAAVAGPLIYVIGSLKIGLATLAGAFAATAPAAAGAAVGVSRLHTALLALAASLKLPLLLLASLAAGVYVLAQRSKIAAQASAEVTKALADSAAASKRATELTLQLASAHGKTRTEALAAAKAERELAKQKLASALASLRLAQAELARLQAYKASSRGIGQTDPRFAGQLPGAGVDKAIADTSADMIGGMKVVNDLLGTISTLGRAIDASAPPPVADVGSGKSDAKAGGGRDETRAVQQRFSSELEGYAQQAISAMISLATSADERAELELRGVELARLRTLAEIEADDSYSAGQKARLAQQLEALVDLERDAIERDRVRQIEREAADLAADSFDMQRDLMQVDLELADTATDRKRIALDILALEQQYRRNQAEMVLASATSLDHEKERARRLLASLGALEAAEAAAADRQNETPVERYRRELDMSVDQVNEAIDGIRIQGLESLNQGLVDAITGVKSLGKVFKQIANQIIADLLRIAIQKAIIAPLADALFGGSGGGGGGGLGNLLGGLKLFGGNVGGAIKLDGARAMGGPVLAGGTYLVGERGPELFRPRSAGSIISNRDLQGGGGVLTVRLEKDGGLTAHMEGIAGRVVGDAAQGIANAGSELAMGRFRKMQERSLVRR